MNTRTQKKIISPEEESVLESSSSGQVTVAALEAHDLYRFGRGHVTVRLDLR